MDELDTGKLRAMLERTAPGPWSAPEIRYRRDALDWRNIIAGDAQVLVGCIRANEYPPGEADLIVAAVNALPTLLDTIDTLRQQLAEARAAALEAAAKVETGWLIEEDAGVCLHWIALADLVWPKREVTVRRDRLSSNYDIETTEWQSPIVRVKDASKALRRRSLRWRAAFC